MSVMRVQTLLCIAAGAWVFALAGCTRLAPQREAPPILAMGAPPVAATREAPVTAPAPPSTTPPEAPAVVKETRPPPEDAERLLTFFERLRRLQGAELAKEHEAARLAYGRAASEFNRVGFAMTLSLPGTPFNDDARALEILNPLIKKSENGLRPLALLLATFVQERRRLGGDLAAVQQKLDALRSLERTLIEREQNNQGRK